MRIATLNIRHGGGTRIGNICSFIAELDLDCILLTEYRNNNSGREIATQLHEAGFIYCSEISGPPNLNQLRWFSKLPLLEFQLGEPNSTNDWCTQRIRVIDIFGTKLIGVYFPQGKHKAPLFEFIKSEFHPQSIKSAALIGDFNTGFHWIDESSNTFQCVENLKDLLLDGWIDAWRSRNPEIREFSWYSNKGNGFRIDNALLSATLNKAVNTIFYTQESIRTKSSDHACLVMDIQVKNQS